jgi:hypothetical protein
LLETSIATDVLVEATTGNGSDRSCSGRLRRSEGEERTRWEGMERKNYQRN